MRALIPTVRSTLEQIDGYIQSLTEWILPPLTRELIGFNKVAVSLLYAIVIVVGLAFVPEKAWCIVGIRTIVTFNFMINWSYWMHRIGHFKWIDYVPFLRLHTRMHHDDEIGQALYAENVAIELLTNMCLIGGLLFLLIPGIHQVLSKRIILLYAISYTFIHVVNYHLPSYGGFHRNHHHDMKCNFGPSIMDSLMNTYVPQVKPDGTPLVEDMTHFVPVFATVACCVLVYIRSVSDGAAIIRWR